MPDISHTKLLPYQPEWREKFQTEKEQLLSVFGNSALAIEHIGSTSIEGLISKPIIDIGVLIGSYKDADKYTELLTKLGYTHKINLSSTERQFYTKGSPIEYHVSIAYMDKGNFWDRQMLFRDYLRNHPESRDEYARLKENLLKNDPSGYNSYISGKSDFVNKILDLSKNSY